VHVPDPIAADVCTADPHPGNVLCVESDPGGRHVSRDDGEEEKAPPASVTDSKSAELPSMHDEMWHPAVLDYGLTARCRESCLSDRFILYVIWCAM
jgi:hypothetical protein